MDLDIIFILGPAGSGKGTQARILAGKLGFFYWEMGAICREVAATATDLGQRVASVINRGVWLNDDMLFEVSRERLEKLPEDTGIIFEGVPRRIGQAILLAEYLKNKGCKNFVSLNITLPDEDAIARLLKRAQIEGRIDDTREGISSRLAQHHEESKKVYEFLKTLGPFFDIDGQPSIEEVTAQIDKALEISM